MSDQITIYTYTEVELAWRSGHVMDCHETARGSNPGRNDVFIEFHVCDGPLRPQGLLCP